MTAWWSQQGCPREVLEAIPKSDIRSLRFISSSLKAAWLCPSPNPFIYVHTPCSFILVGPRDRCFRKNPPVRCAHNGWRGVGTRMQTDPICSGRDCVGRRVNGGHRFAGFRLSRPDGRTPLFEESHRASARDLLASTSSPGAQAEAPRTGWRSSGNVVSGGRRRLGARSRVPHRLSADHSMS